MGAMPLHACARSLATAGLVFLIAGCTGTDSPLDLGPRATVVTVATARTGELRDVANASGAIVPSSVADVTVYATEPAEILELPKALDDTVAIGDVLVRFDIASLNQELAALELDVIESQTRLDRARADLTRQTALFERGIIARVAYDESRFAHAAAESALAAAQARFESLRAGQTRGVVRASLAGVVVGLWHEVGDAVRPDQSDPILRIVDPTRVQVSLQLPVLQLARVNAGQSAVVRAIAGETDEPATVASKMQSADPSVPTGEVRLNFVTPSTLPIDTPVSAEILLERRLEALLIPSAAISRDDFGPFVMVAGDDGLAHRRDVRLGLVTPQLTQVTDGLIEGERVILSTPGQIADQEPVAISR